jgi:glycosyltransferase involved in cell wall biosynthesis
MSTGKAPWHLMTCEFPPAIGGVSDHSRVLADTAAARGLDVHVWAPSGAGADPGVEVHDSLGSFSAADLDRTDCLLDRFAHPRRIVLQWVPHGYGRRGLNVRFSRWISHRAGRGDELDVIVHEPFVDFTGRSWMQPARAVVQRYMARNVLRAARRVWLSIPGWENRLDARWLGLTARPLVLPVPGTVRVNADATAVARLRTRLLDRGGRHLVGYFGAGGPYAEHALAVTLKALRSRTDMSFVCFGRGSEEVAARVSRLIAGPAGTLPATGALTPAELSQHLQACDVLLQPYEDGVSGRRTTTISALEHGLPVATTFGRLSESFWRGTQAIATVPADTPGSLADAVVGLLEPDRHHRARASARALYQERFDPAVALRPLFAD